MSRFGVGLSAATEHDAWSWIAPALGDFGTVGGMVPTGFERYVRLDHGDDQGQGTWDLPAEVVEWVVAVGSDHTSTPDRAYFAVWEGYGWLNATMLYSQAERGRFSLRRKREDPFREVLDEFEDQKSELRAELESLPKLDLAQRAYFVLTGELAAVATFSDPLSPTRRRVPDLWWPADRGWFVGSDTDLDGTYVGGSEQFTTSLIEAWPGLASPVDPGDPLS